MMLSLRHEASCTVQNKRAANPDPGKHTHFHVNLPQNETLSSPTCHLSRLT